MITVDGTAVVFSLNLGVDGLVLSPKQYCVSVPPEFGGSAINRGSEILAGIVSLECEGWR